MLEGMRPALLTVTSNANAATNQGTTGSSEVPDGPTALRTAVWAAKLGLNCKAPRSSTRNW